MPADNIKRAIQRGTGELEGVSYEEITYEGYGPGGVAIIIDVLTDNKNRAVSEIRHAFSKNGGNLGAEGAVSWMFTKKGVISIAKDAADEDKLMEIVLEAGAEDLNDEGTHWEILCDPKDFEAVTERPEGRQDHPRARRSHQDRLSTYTKLEGTQANAMMRLLETIEDLDDTQNVYSNFDFDEASDGRCGPLMQQHLHRSHQ
jgi:YebC/PmpR family DNA-binding regulatory protein